MRTESAIAALVLAVAFWAASATAQGADADAPAEDCVIPADIWKEHRAGYCMLPPDVRAFVVRNDACEHFLGEEPYDAERRKQLEAAFRKYCKGARNTFDTLMARYRNDAATRAWLQRYGEEMTLP